MNEQQFIAKVHKKLPKTTYRVKFSDKFVAGIPDTWYSGPAGDLWVEYKYQEAAGHKPKLSDLQKAWLIDRHAEGRSVACVVGTPEGVIIYEGTSWIDYKQYVLTPFTEYIAWIQHKTTCSESPS
jgi:hypothetical protein